MARNPTAAQLAAIKSHLAEFEPRIRAAFLDAIYSARAAVDVDALISALDAGNVARAVEALDISQAQAWRLAEEVRASYLWMGEAQIAAIAPAGFGGASWRFDGTNPRAIDWIAQHSADLIQGIVTDSRDAVRAVITDSLQRTTERTVRSTALDIVGRINKATGRREGGILGLTTQQAQYVTNARADLENLDRRYFTRAQRDRRFDGLVRKAIADGKPLSQADIDRITARYSDRLLSYRGDVIARNETFQSQAASRQEAMQQVLMRNDVETVTKRWQVGFPKEPRENHLALAGKVIGFDEKFDLGNGVTCDCPHDDSLPPEEAINCRCSCVYRPKLRRD